MCADCERIAQWVCLIMTSGMKSYAYMTDTLSVASLWRRHAPFMCRKREPEGNGDRSLGCIPRFPCSSTRKLVQIQRTCLDVHVQRARLLINATAMHAGLCMCACTRAMINSCSPIISWYTFIHACSHTQLLCTCSYTRAYTYTLSSMCWYTQRALRATALACITGTHGRGHAHRWLARLVDR
jgi:hypothetical protein